MACMDALHYGGQNIEEERELVNNSVNKLRDLTGQNISVGLVQIGMRATTHLNF